MTLHEISTFDPARGSIRDSFVVGLLAKGNDLLFDLFPVDEFIKKMT
jgi:hypothetical protein